MVYNVLVLLAIFGGIEMYLEYQMNHSSSAPAWLQKPMRKYYHDADIHIIQMDSNCAQYSKALFYELKPGEFEFYNRDFSTVFKVNSKGFRDDEKSLNCPKVICLGDSYTMGWGVEGEETFSELLEDHLTKRVLNMGVSSYGTAREIASLEKVNTDSLEYLIIQYCPNDLQENKEYVLANNSLRVSSREVYTNASNVHMDRAAYYPFKHLINISKHLSEKKEETIVKKELTERQLLLNKITFENAFLQILRDSKKIPKTTKIILFSLEAEYVHNGFNQGIKKVLDKDFTSSLYDQVSYVDLTGKIDSTHRFSLDPHLNAIGHSVVCREIAQHIEQLKSINGSKVWRYENGDTMLVINYQDGVKDGPMLCFWSKDKISRISHYISGSKTGEEIDYYENGLKKRTAHYQNDSLIGWEIHYDSLGVKLDSTYFN